MEIILFTLIILLFVRLNTLSNKLIDLQHLYLALQQTVSTLSSNKKTIQSNNPSDEITPSSSTIIDSPLSEKINSNEVHPFFYDIPQTKEMPISKPTSKKPSRFKTWLFTGNPIAKMGLLILFVGIAFLLKFTSQYFILSIELRLIGVGLGGLLMLALGWRLYKTQPLYGHILQGGGVGLLFLTIYTSFAFYHVITPVLAFGLLLLLLSFSAFIAIKQDAKLFAIFAILGAFIAPLLINTGQENHLLLFSYYAIINTGILCIAWYKSWRGLNTLGFICTFILSGLWGYTYYQATYFNSTECFLILFFLFYICISLLYAAHKPGQYTGMVDTLLTFGLPLCVFTYQLSLVRYIPHADAWSAYGLGLFYSVLAAYLWYAQVKSMLLIREAFTAIAVIFFTLAIPLGFSQHVSVLLWALEGAAIVWIGLKQNHLYARIFGILVQFGSAALFLLSLPLNPEPIALFNHTYINGVCIALAGLISAYCWYSYCYTCTTYEKQFSKLVFVWGALWWYWIGLREISLHLPLESVDKAQLLFVTGSTLVFWTLSEILSWAWLRYLFLILPLQMCMYAFAISTTLIPSDLLTWLASFTVFYSLLYRLDRSTTEKIDFLHILGLWLLAGVISYQLYQTLLSWTYYSDTWNFIITGAVFTGLLALIRFGAKHLAWPLQKHALTYQGVGGFGLACALLVGMFAANLSLEGNVQPFIYLPLLNPLDIVLTLSFIVSLSWFNQRTLALKQSNSELMNCLYSIYSILGFVFITAMLLRTLHTIFDIPFALEDLWDSTIVQATLSICWTLLALILTFIAARARWRAVWFAGVILILIVIAKLFVIDLSNSSTLARIITFISVGVLLLINGYLSPLPPKENKSLK